MVRRVILVHVVLQEKGENRETQEYRVVLEFREKGENRETQEYRV